MLLQFNPSRSFQTFEVTSEYSEPYGEYFYVPNNPELLLYRVLEQLNNNRKHGAVDGDELEREDLLILLLWLQCGEWNDLREGLCVRR